VLTIEQAPAYIYVSPRTLRRMLAARRISYLKIGSLVRLFKPDLDQYLADCLVEAVR
jgi:excisionase family DNA binding protein